MRHIIWTLLASILIFSIACNKKSRQVQDKEKDQFEDEFTVKGDLPEEYDATASFSEASELTVEGDIDVIAFGSCNKHDLPQPLWGPILTNKPDIWIWLGDAVYGDSEDEGVLRSKYNAQDDKKGYQKLKETSQVIGTWDDHDYGKNDGTKHFSGKKAAKNAFLDFLDVSKEHPTRKREGIYQSYTVGEGSKKVKIILLDNRTFRDKVKRNEKKVYVPDTEADILGEAQWKWLASELKNNDATITIIANGTQVLSRFHPYEKWANYPTSRKRLFKMIKTYKTSGVVLLSGDRHHAELSKVNIPDLKHPLYEFTSSGLTHGRKYPRPEENKFRVGDKVDKLNFGIMRINWATNPVKVTFEVRGEQNKKYESCTFEIMK